MQDIKKVFGAILKTRVEAGMHQRWGAEDSNAVIIGVVEADVSNHLATPSPATEDAEPKAYVMSDAAKAIIAKVVNPSAFAQVLEDMPEESGLRIKRPERGTKAKTSLSSLLPS